MCDFYCFQIINAELHRINEGITTRRIAGNDGMIPH